MIVSPPFCFCFTIVSEVDGCKKYIQFYYNLAYAVTLREIRKGQWYIQSANNVKSVVGLK